MHTIYLIIASVTGLLATIFGIEKLFSDSFKTKPRIIAGLYIIAAIFTFLFEYSKEPEATTINNQFIFNDTVGAYKHGYDSATKQFYKLMIKESLAISPSAIPQIAIHLPATQVDNPNINFTFDKGIYVDSFTNDIISVRVSLSSYFAPSILKEATLYCLYSYNQNENIIKDLIYDGKVPFLNINLRFDKNFYWDGGVIIPGFNLEKIKTIIILVKGSYTDSYGNNPQPLDIIGDYDLVSKKFGSFASPYDDSVRIFLKNKGIIINRSII